MVDPQARWPEARPRARWYHRYLGAAQPGAEIAAAASFTDAHRVEIASLAARYRLPAVYPYRFFAEVGGLPLRNAATERHFGVCFRYQ